MAVIRDPAFLIIGKWRIRAEWADTHPGEMTEQGYEALTIDGANRALGPTIDGVQAGLIFVGVAAVLFVIRLAIRKQPVKPPAETPPEIETKVATDLRTSDNRYHPPADSA